METEAAIKKYIYDWLSGLGIGPVFQDRKPLDDKTKLKNSRTYIVYDFPDGIENEGPWFRGICYVCIGCRDKERFVADMTTLDNVCATFLNQFDRNDEDNGVVMFDPEYDSDYSDGVGNHEYRYSFEFYVDR